MIIEALELSAFIICLGILGCALVYLIDKFIYSNLTVFEFITKMWLDLISFIERFGKK